MKRISEFLDSTKGLGRFFNDRRVEDDIRAAWVEVAGQFSRDLKISYFREKNLYLSSSNPVWQAEVSFISDHIKDALKKRFKRAVVERVVVVSETESSKLSEVIGKPSTELSLESLIKIENQRRVDRGMRLCFQCGDIYVDDGLCIFCRSENG